MPAGVAVPRGPETLTWTEQAAYEVQAEPGQEGGLEPDKARGSPEPQWWELHVVLWAPSEPSFLSVGGQGVRVLGRRDPHCHSVGKKSASSVQNEALEGQ